MGPCPERSSLVSGSTSHKSVTKEQSWILWSYYNNSVSLSIPYAFREAIR